MSRVDTVDICRCKMMYSQLWDVKMLILADWELLSDLKSFYSKARVGHQRVAVQIPRRQFSMTRCTWCWIAVDLISLLQVGLSENIWKWDIPPLPNYHISSTYHQHIIIIHHISSCSPFFMAIFGGIRYIPGIPHSQTVVKKMLFALGLWHFSEAHRHETPWRISDLLELCTGDNWP